MKKFITSAVFIFVFAGYALNQYLASPAASATSTISTTQTVASQPVAENTTPTPTPTPVVPTPTPTPIPTPTPTPAPKPTGQYVDGTYTGDIANAYYGYVQVQVSVSGGKIADVQFLQYPSDRSTSRFINGQAMPILRSQAIQVQSASVDGVSGATDTSYAFRESLSAALAQAKA